MQIRIDPIACDAHGVCVELLPEVIVLDDWGFPLLLVDAVPRELESLADHAAGACPTLAITIGERD